jgi:hypothetical protein
MDSAAAPSEEDELSEGKSTPLRSDADSLPAALPDIVKSTASRVVRFAGVRLWRDCFDFFCGVLPTASDLPAGEFAH